MAQFPGHPRDAPNDVASDDDSAAEPCPDDRRHGGLLHGARAEGHVVGIQRGRIAVVVVHHGQLQPVFQPGPKTESAPRRAASLTDEMTPSALAGPGLSKPTPRTADRAVPVSSRTLLSAEASADNATSGPCWISDGFSTSRSTGKGPCAANSRGRRNTASV